MKRIFTEAVLNRRTCYSITNNSPVSNEEIKEIIEFAVLNTPSAFNSQSSRCVLLFGEASQQLWRFVMEALCIIVSKDQFEATEQKINSFSAGYGTVLFFEDNEVIHALQEKFPLYAAYFDSWSDQTAGMLQFTSWTMLENIGLGASLQHYNVLIEASVKKHWDLPQTWKLISQMPFGAPSKDPEEKTFKPIEERVYTFEK